MKTKHILTAILIGICSICSAQKDTTWAKWNWLIGEWRGEGTGKPGEGSGSFSFAFDLDQKILERNNHTVFPATDKNPEMTHDDLMIVYPDIKGIPSKAIYFDNEGHVINYSVTFLDKNIVLTSDKIPDIPVFRLTYAFIDNKTAGIRFEMSNDGEKFMTYLDGMSIKIK